MSRDDNLSNQRLVFYENNVLRLNAEIDTFPPDDVLSRGRSIGEAENDSMGTARIQKAKAQAIDQT